MKMDVCIPSHHRPEKLTRCLKSIEAALIPDVKVYVYFSDPKDKESLGFPYKFSWIEARICEEYEPAELWAKHLREMSADVMFLLTDDCEIFPDTLKQIAVAFAENFPDTDGVIGVHMVGIRNQMRGAMSVTGKKFSDRFPKSQIFCPDYRRFFMDTEYTIFADRVGRFLYDPNKIKLIHHHPILDHANVDATHHEVREFLGKDQSTFVRRQQYGYLWGRDFLRSWPCYFCDQEGHYHTAEEGKHTYYCHHHWDIKNGFKKGTL